ncbi:hypothetical protein A0H81_01073 [Grifola frondosa]|uniref:Uncharacterized protein n=1 Tax=Grifola frondosa TaxID=5627 RepID=A0A1C7MSY8_GRIFR|nr:hypothetical protein A0H81_01073 [Grifola frondosa]
MVTKSDPFEDPQPAAPQTAGPSLPQLSRKPTRGRVLSARGEQPPPQFTPYEAEYFLSGGNIVSHDRHLNEDGEALYRFLLSHSQAPPTYLLHFYGDHMESRMRMVTRTEANGQTRTEPDILTTLGDPDFDFSIDVGQSIASGPVHWSVPDEEPAYRGKMYEEVDTRTTDTFHAELGVRRKAAKEEIKRAKQWEEEKKATGLPPWIGPYEGWDGRNPLVDPPAMSVLRSSKTLREWADEYCASDKLLKEFIYRKIVYGWQVAGLGAAAVAAVKATYYSGNYKVDFEISNDKIYIRPDNRLSRTLSNKWIVFLLWILLIYPFIWLYKRFGQRGGGQWKVCGGAYALKSWQLVDPAFDPPPPFPGTNDWRMTQTSAGPAKLVGLREGEWFQRWEGTIRRAVSGRLESKTPLMHPDDAPTSAAIGLDGYQAYHVV